MGEISRFRSIRQAISYCGLCGDERSSAEKSIRTPISKQRNKNIQFVLIEAAKLAPRQDHDLALLYEREKQKGNANRATLAVARKMVAYFLPWIDDNGLLCLHANGALVLNQSSIKSICSAGVV